MSRTGQEMARGRKQNKAKRLLRGAVAQPSLRGCSAQENSRIKLFANQSLTGRSELLELVLS